MKQEIELVGVGIGYQEIARYYPTHVTVNEVSQLPQQLVKSLRRKLGRH